MERIAAPILRNDRGAAVHNLQDGLILLLTANGSALPEVERRVLVDKLTGEQRGGSYGEVTTEAVAGFERDHRVAFNLPLGTGERVDDATAGAMNRLLQELGVFERARPEGFLISGCVEFEDGSPAVGLRVSAFDRDLGRRRVRLGDREDSGVTADENGVFPTIRYQAREVAEGEGRRGPNADVVFEVAGAKDQITRDVTSLYRRFTTRGETSETPVSDLVLGFEAAPVEDVRIVIAGRPTEQGFAEYKRLMLALEPLLLDGATPADFDQERARDIDFSARETGWDRALIETMTLAWQLAGSATREPLLLAETFYGLLRHGAPTEVAPLASRLSELLDQDARWTSKLEDSLAHSIIDGALDEHIGRLRDLRTDAATRVGDGRRGGIGDVLAHAGIPEDERRTLLGAYHAHAGTNEAFWRDVVPHRLGWEAPKIRGVQTALRLAEVVAYDMALMTRLLDGGVVEPRELVHLDRPEWIKLVTQVGPLPDAPGATVDDRITRTVDAITSVLDATYPTESVAKIARTSSDPKLAAARDLLSRFFESETATEDGRGFDVRTSPVTTYLETHGDRVFRELQSNDKALLTSQLQRLQRVFRLGVDRAQTETLLDLSLDSAFHITRFSPEHFAQEFGERLGGAEKAGLAYGRAERIAGTVLYMQAELWHGLHSVKPAALMAASEPEKIPALKELPAYKALFGSLEMCDCGHCESFYSPAAYFVDLLHMIDRPSLGKALNPVEVLFRRRPDLAHIQLTCENTNTLIPYVDLVTEILESFVANGAPTPFNVPPGAPNRRLPSPSAEELRVNPVYLTAASSGFADKAYKALQDAVFPLTLPLNLPLETTRTYLDHLGVNRAELMALFDRDPGLEAQMARAAETLLLSPEEFEVISGVKFGGAQSRRPATTPELFGLSMAGTPATLFNHVAPEFVLSAPSDERAALIRSLQNVLRILAPPTIPVTGTYEYDVATEAAVKAFQTKEGLVPNGRTDAAFWGALEAHAMPPLSVMLCPVPMFLDRSGLSYEELVALVKTRFVNPALQGQGDLDYLARLGIPDADVRAWIEAGLPAMPTAIQNALAKAAEDPIAFTTWVERRARSVVINMGFESPCDLDRATLMHLDGTLLSPAELVTLFHFVRVWRKLNWTISDLDLVLEPGALESAAIFQTVLLLANVKQLHDRTGAPIADLVTLWQTIPRLGAPAAYDRLFRNRAAQLIDPILELNRDRTQLKAAEGATPPALSDHIGPVRAAFRLSAQDLASLRKATGLDDQLAPPSLAPLNLTSLSAIHTHVSLARTLQVSVRELLTLIDLAGVAVFERPDRVPRGHALAFVDIVEKVRTSGVKVGVLEYLCRAVPQPPALAGTERVAWSGALATIVDGLHAIASEDPIKDDPDGEELTARLTGLIGPDDARATTALVYGRDVYKESLVGLPAGFGFPTAAISYDAVRKELKLRGAMTAGDRGLVLAAPGVPLAVQPAYLRAVKALDAQARTFVARALKAMFSSAEAEAALIDVSSLDAVGAPIPARIATKAAAVLARRRLVLSRSLIKQTLATATGLAADVVAVLLEDEAVLKAVGGVGPAMDDYQAIDGDGLDAAYFKNPNLIDPVVLQRIDETIGFDLQGKPPAPGIPAVAFSVRWTGNLYVEATGEVGFRVRCSDGIHVTVNGTVVFDEWRDQSETEFNATLRLDGGQFYPIEVRYYNKTGDALLKLSWSSPSIPASIIPQAALYTSARFEALRQRIERVYKIALLLTPFTVAARDLQHLAEHGDLALDVLPVVGPAGLPVAQAMFAQWLAVYDFAALRDRYPGSDVSLMDVLSAPTRDAAIERFHALTGAAATTLDAIVDAFAIRVFDAGTMTWKTEEPDVTTLAWWGRIADALALVQRTGAAPEQLLAWAGAREITELPTGPETLWLAWTTTDEAATDRVADNASRAQAARDLVRAHYDETRWRTEARALNDVLRVRRRSALTAFVLAMPAMMRARVSSSGRLLEFLLIDVEMESCMETARIPQAIFSVQQFINRVLLDLESPQVPPARVDRARWEWTKNYRVWEANRKVWLYAESYTEEALRDDKTPIFKEFESELLQDELNEPNAERVFRRYLEKLDSVAKLIVCGTCVDSDASVLHVFARTSTTPFVFYHRWLSNSSALSWAEGVWSPWQKLPPDVATIIDGDNSGAHLMPIVWNRRLYLFWPVFEQKYQDRDNALLPEGFDQIQCWHITLAWSEYKDGRWSPKQTGVPVVISKSFVLTQKTPSYPETESFHPPPFKPVTFQYPDQVVPIPLTTLTWTIPGQVVTLPRTLTDSDDPMLSGTVLEQPNDFAVHDRDVDIVNVLSLLPKPAAHYLDASVDATQLTIRVFSRFKGTPKGQGRKVITDTISIVQGGRRTDRKERSQEDYPVSGEEQLLFNHVGTFRFPACGAHLDLSDARVFPKYNDLERPKYTINSFMALRNDWPGGPGLRLTSGASPILAFVPTPFDVIDSDNRSGFNRNGPFFYQDQRRCYLVTREMYARFDVPDVRWTGLDVRAPALERAVGVATLANHQLGIGAEAALSVNPWAGSALTKWAAGPGLISALGSGAPPEMHTLSGSVSLESLLSKTLNYEFHELATRPQPEYRFIPHWHPYTCPFIAALNVGGLPGLFTLENERRTDVQGKFVGPILTGLTNNFESIYEPDPNQVAKPFPGEEVDFGLSGSYSKYNWETFFHAPMTVAMAYSRAGRYEDALRWFHFVFDPMTSDSDTSKQRFWRFVPFRKADTATIEETIGLLTYSGSDSETLKKRANLQALIQEWLEHPFNPHLIARRRPVVYMKYVFMKYVDTLIAWADELFQDDTRESITEATQHLVLAANLLGTLPHRVAAPGPAAPETYETLRKRLDALSNAQVDLETRLPFTQLFRPGTGTVGQLSKLPQALYFCLPQNDQMLAYWDRIADRLFKIRHCMSIDGTVRQLPLFEPAVDPRVFVEAVHRGVDIGSVLNDLYAPLPRYRFTFMLQQALAMCNEVRSLGNALLSASEKLDGGLLSTQRAEQERQLLDLVKANKKLQIDESEQSRQALEETARVTTARIDYYEGLLAQGLISEETDQLASLDHSNQQQETASWLEASAQALNLIPNVSTGSPPSTSFGGSHLGAAASAIGRSHSGAGAAHSYRSNRASITGGHTRRKEEWRFQRDQGKRELKQVERQKAAARIRKEITQIDLRNHETAIEHARGIEDLLRTKFTSDALYGWMEGQLRIGYFQCYKAAYELARGAQRCFQYQLGTDATFVKFGAWDSSVRGLLAGERLYLQLKQMERAYVEHQVREFEIAKDVSVAQLDPLALIALRETGQCEVEVPEWLFDIDYAGHYFRRLKTVSVSIPAVVGRTTSLSATVTLLNSKVRKSSQIVGAYGDEDNYRHDQEPVEAIAVSTAQNDSGRFQLDFRDEKYLPFEGAGAIGRWRIELPRNLGTGSPDMLRSVDYDTFSDVLLHLKYTSRRDGALAGPAQDALRAQLAAAGSETLFQLFSLRHEFPNEWHTLRSSNPRAATVSIAKERFPILVRQGTIAIDEIHTAVILKAPRPTVTYKATLTPGAGAPIDFVWSGAPGRYRSDSKTVTIPISATPGDNGWRLQLTAPTLPADIDAIRDILVAVRYSVKM